MKHKSFLLAVIALLAASCTNESLDSSVNCSDEQGMAPVTVRVDGFEVSQGEISPSRRTTAIGDYENLEALTLAFYKSDGTESYKATQFKADASTYTTFGEFSTALPMGSYTMVVLGYLVQDDAPVAVSLTSPTSATFTEEKCRETFAATQSFTITNNTAVNLTATLNRIVAKVVLASTDNRDPNVSSLRVTFSGGSKSFNPTTGLATDNNGYVNTLVNPHTGQTTFTSFLFLPVDEQNVNVTIQTLDANGDVLFNKTVNNVPLKRNRETKLTGALYHADNSAGSFQLNTDWLTGNVIDF